MSAAECEVQLKPEFVAPPKNKEKGDLGMAEWHGTKYEHAPCLCQSFVRGEPCTRQNCNRLHDVDEYKRVRQPPLDLECPNMAAYGRCNFKWNCVFSHPGDVFAAEGGRERQPYGNTLGYQAVKAFDFQTPREARKKAVAFDPRGKLFLAPMCTVGTLPFRRWCKDFGCDVTCSEMVFARDLLSAQGPELSKLRRHASEDLFGIQLTGSGPELKKATQLIAELCETDYIELNAACPQDVATNRHCGFRIAQENRIAGCLEQMGEVCRLYDVALSVKTRIGDFQGESRLEKILKQDLRGHDASMVTLHGRTAKQRYSKNADWEALARFATEAREGGQHNFAFIGNGDLFNVEGYLALKSQEICDSFMIGRGALTKPWIFREFKEGKQLDPSSSQRIEWLRNFATYCIDYYGSDRQGVEKAREQFLENYVYLCRYVPTGILAAPQELNQRNTAFNGRDEMETLLGSHEPADWVKVTELFFGSVPEGFKYQPKHRSKGSVGM